MNRLDSPAENSYERRAVHTRPFFEELSNGLLWVSSALFIAFILLHLFAPPLLGVPLVLFAVAVFIAWSIPYLLPAADRKRRSGDLLKILGSITFFFFVSNHFLGDPFGVDESFGRVATAIEHGLGSAAMGFVLIAGYLWLVTAVARAVEQICLALHFETASYILPLFIIFAGFAGMAILNITQFDTLERYLSPFLLPWFGVSLIYLHGSFLVQKILSARSR